MTLPRLSLAALLTLAVPLSGAGLLAEDDALPKPLPAARYELMAARSPFTAPTVALPAPTPAPAPAGPHWWDQMYITSLMEAGGAYFAIIVDKANNKRYVLETNKPDEDSHLVLTEVQWNERADQSTVVVRRGTEVAPALRFDPSAASSASPAASFNPPADGRGNRLKPPPPPPNFTGAPPPPPPTANVVRRIAPIGSTPTQQPNPAVPRPGRAPTDSRRPLSRGQDDGG